MEPELAAFAAMCKAQGPYRMGYEWQTRFMSLEFVMDVNGKHIWRDIQSDQEFYSYADLMTGAMALKLVRPGFILGKFEIRKKRDGSQVVRWAELNPGIQKEMFGPDQGLVFPTDINYSWWRPTTEGEGPAGIVLCICTGVFYRMRGSWRDFEKGNWALDYKSTHVITEIDMSKTQELVQMEDHE